MPSSHESVHFTYKISFLWEPPTGFALASQSLECWCVVTSCLTKVCKRIWQSRIVLFPSSGKNLKLWNQNTFVFKRTNHEGNKQNKIWWYGPHWNEILVFFVIFRIMFVYVHMCVPRRAHEGEPKGWGNFLLLPCDLQGSNSGLVASTFPHRAIALALN